MGRLIEIVSGETCPAHLVVQVGDVLLCRSTGGRLRPASAAIEVVGVLRTAVIGTHGGVLAPEGLPDVFLCRAVGAGACTLELVFGDPFGPHHTAALEVTVEA